MLSLAVLKTKIPSNLKYFIHGGFWLLLTQFITICGSLVTTAVFAHILDSNEYGTYRYLVSLAVLFTTFSLTGMSQSVLQATAKGNSGFYRQATRYGLLYSLGIVIIGLSGTAYYLYTNNTILAFGCLFIAAIQPFVNAGQNIVALLQGLKEFRLSAKIQILKISFITICSLICIFFTHNILYLFITYLLTQAFSSIVLHVYANKQINHHKYHPLDDTSSDNKYLNYAKHLSLQNFISGIATRIDSVIVFQQLGATNLAIFNIVSVVPDQVKGAFKNLLPLTVTKYAHLDTEHVSANKIFVRSLQLTFILVIAAVVAAVLFPIFYQLFFPKYIDHVFYAQILMIGLPATVLLIPQSILQIRLSDAKLHKINFYASLLQIVTTITFIYGFGLFGAIIAKIISRYILCFFNYYYLLRGTN